MLATSLWWTIWSNANGRRIWWRNIQIFRRMLRWTCFGCLWKQSKLICAQQHSSPFEIYICSSLILILINYLFINDHNFEFYFLNPGSHHAAAFWRYCWTSRRRTRTFPRRRSLWIWARMLIQIPLLHGFGLGVDYIFLRGRLLCKDM